MIENWQYKKLGEVCESANGYTLPPINLQDRFAEKIEKIEEQKEAINKSIEETQKLFDFTLDKYFG